MQTDHARTRSRSLDNPARRRYACGTLYKTDDVVA